MIPAILTGTASGLLTELIVHSVQSVGKKIKQQKNNGEKELGEKELLEKIAETLESYKKTEHFQKMSIPDVQTLKVEIENVYNNYYNGSVDNKEQYQDFMYSLLETLEQGKDMPYLDIMKTNELTIRSFNSVYAFYENVFDFNKSSDDYRESARVLTFSVKNTGGEPIKEVHISNVQISFLEEDCYSFQDDYYELRATKHQECLSCKMAISPSEEQKIHLIVTRKEEELQHEEECEVFWEDYGEDMLYMEMDITVVGATKNNSYRVCVHLSKTNSDEEEMHGNYAIENVMIREVNNDES